MCGQWSKSRDLKSKMSLFFGVLHLHPAPVVILVQDEYKSQFLRSSSESWLQISHVLSWMGLQNYTGKQGEEKKKMPCTAREKFLRWCWFSRWLDSGWLISGTKKRSLDTAIICFSWVYQTGMRKLKKPLCGFLKHISNFFFYIANKVLKIQQLSKWLLNLCCPHHVASRLSEVAIQN